MKPLSLCAVVALAGALAGAAPATEHAPSVQGRVVRVIDAGTLDVRLAGGTLARVRVLGIAAPARGECFAAAAMAQARTLALGKQVQLAGESTRPARAYVALPGGVDLGRLLVARGAAQIDVWGPAFSRFVSYVPAQQSAEQAGQGLWGACAADVAVALEATPAVVGVGAELTYTVTVTNRGPLRAPSVAVELRPPAGAAFVSAGSDDGACTSRGWYGACSFASVASGATVTGTFIVTPTRTGTVSARASVRFSWCVRSPCGAAPLHDPDRRNDESAALTTVLDDSPPPPPLPPPGPPPPAGPPPPPAGSCHPSYPTVCIPPPPPDLDCADIPFRDFSAPVDVPDPDPHDLDGDEDGIGCQFNDY